MKNLSELKLEKEKLQKTMDSNSKAINKRLSKNLNIDDLCKANDKLVKDIQNINSEIYKIEKTKLIIR